MYAGVLKDTALIRYLRYDVEDQLFQFIDGLSMEELVVDENQCEKDSAKSTSSQKDAARIQYITGQSKRLHCMQSSIFFDINGPKMSTAYAKVRCALLDRLRVSYFLLCVVLRCNVDISDSGS